MRNKLVFKALMAAGVVVALVTLGLWATRTQTAEADPAYALSVVGPAAPVAVGSNFDVKLHIEQGAEADYSAMQYQITYDSTVINYVSALGLAKPPFDACAKDPTGAPGAKYGCLVTDPTVFIHFSGDTHSITYKCMKAGTSPLDLINYDPLLTPLNTWVKIGTAAQTITVSHASVECVEAADMEIDKTASPADPLAGSNVTYSLDVHNGGPQTANHVVITDVLPPEKEFVSCVVHSILGDMPCDAGYNSGTHTVTIPLIANPTEPDPSKWMWLPIDPSVSLTIDIVVHVPLSEAGKTNVNYARVDATAGPMDPDPDNSEDTAIVNVKPAVVTASKVGLPNPALVGGSVVWAVTVSNAAGASPATAVSVKDTADANQSIVSAAGTNWTSCTVTGTPGVTPANSVTCTLTGTLAAGTSAPVLSVTANVLGAVGDKCLNDASGNFADPYQFWTGLAAGIDAQDPSVVCQLPTILEGYDKGAAAQPASLSLPAGGSGSSLVSEVIYVVSAGANPNIIHTWTATATGNVKVAWVGHTPPGASDVITWTTVGYHNGDEVTVSQGLNVYCTGDSGGTVNLSLAMLAGNNPAPSPTQIKVNCETGSQVKSPASANLWLCEGVNCRDVNGPLQGRGQLVINENVSGISGDPLGAGAFEFQVKFDHKIFDIVATETNWLWATGRVKPAGACAMTIINENSIMFACVSKNANPPAITYGNAAAGTIAKLTLTPEIDMKYRLTPGQQNGVVRTILDENCEIADIWGDPIGGALPGGLLPVCGNTTITIRILEGDLNLDCAVNVVDDQAIAYRYGASFGNLLYDPWFDLEPALKDFDIDIKDLQKVFGRNGSNCSSPIPAQDPLSPPS